MDRKQLLLLTLFFTALLFTSCEENTQPVTDNLDEVIGQMIMVGFRGYDITADNPIVNDLVNNKICGVILFDYDVTLQKFERNVQSPEQLQNLISKVKQYSAIKPLIAIDMEGGRVNRLKTNYGFPATVSAQYLGNINNLDTTKFYAGRIAGTLKEMGINLNLAPVVDVNVNPDNPVIGKIERSFSPDPNMVIKHAAEYIKSHHDYNILTSLKHFPGHGSSTSDSHYGFTDVTDTWQDIELQPYSGLLNQGVVDLVMTAHIFNAKFDSIYPATLSYNTITKVLRDSLKFRGVVISDDMQMKAITDNFGLETAIEKSIKAGVDIILFANNLIYDPDIVNKTKTIILQLVADGKISRERLMESYNRIKELKLSLLK
jgi:beta-N-acetylhexosaminidase